MACDFSLKHYKEILDKALDAKYVLLPLKEFRKKSGAKRLVLLRHDIDFDPWRALELARVEKQAGVKATYFVRVHYDGYNPFGFKANAALREIEELGHEIGLHYECNDFARVSGVSASEALKREKAFLEAALGHAVKGCAAHRDFTGVNNLKFWKSGKSGKNGSGRGKTPRDYGFDYEAYGPEFSSLFYVSDSLKKWRGGKCPCRLLGEKERLYILTHPIYWR